MRRGIRSRRILAVNPTHAAFPLPRSNVPRLMHRSFQGVSRPKTPGKKDNHAHNEPCPGKLLDKRCDVNRHAACGPGRNHPAQARIGHRGTVVALHGLFAKNTKEDQCAEDVFEYFCHTWISRNFNARSFCLNPSLSNFSNRKAAIIMPKLLSSIYCQTLANRGLARTLKPVILKPRRRAIVGIQG